MAGMNLAINLSFVTEGSVFPLGSIGAALKTGHDISTCWLLGKGTHQKML